MITRYDTEGRRMAAEVSTIHRAWCEGCGWKGPERQYIHDADRDRQKHDAENAAAHAVPSRD